MRTKLAIGIAILLWAGLAGPVQAAGQFKWSGSAPANVQAGATFHIWVNGQEKTEPRDASSCIKLSSLTLTLGSDQKTITDGKLAVQYDDQRGKGWCPSRLEITPSYEGNEAVQDSPNAIRFQIPHPPPHRDLVVAQLEDIALQADGSIQGNLRFFFSNIHGGAGYSWFQSMAVVLVAVP